MKELATSAVWTQACCERTTVAFHKWVRDLGTVCGPQVWMYLNTMLGYLCAHKVVMQDVLYVAGPGSSEQPYLFPTACNQDKGSRCRVMQMSLKIILHNIQQRDVQPTAGVKLWLGW